MATQFPETIGVPYMHEPLSEHIDPIAVQINQSIDRLIFLLNQRRAHLLATLRNTREEMRTDLVAREEVEEEVDQTRRFIERQIKHNKLHTLQNRMVAEMEAKMAELRLNAQPPQELRFLCDAQDLEERISCLGEIDQHEIRPISPMPSILNYAAFQQPIIAVGKTESGPGEFNGPQGVTIEPESEHICVADMFNSRIQIISQEGHHLNHFGDRHLSRPYGILIHVDNIYVTDLRYQAIFLFKLPDLTMIKRVGKLGSSSEEFYHPRQLAISPNQHIYVSDQFNNRVQILTTDLVFEGSLRHQTMTTPVDIKFSNNEMFVLSSVDNPCIHVFTLSGEKSRSLVTRGPGMEVIRPFFFCLDENNNFVISDWSAHSIKVFSPEGDLLHTIGQIGQKTGMLYHPSGITIHNTKLICISSNKNFGLQIFSDNN
ncbi:hypothetical protein LOD99_8406 [Oopsacas minuta]|uniref:Uncharacterized protein n=1 Tax=Oopsacas minuta TaxID=111878 RepID=A0AAV7JGW4_9METZ|nr:hypothetical protein LOD99_8406 [Oopsacas minuta]